MKQKCTLEEEPKKKRTRDEDGEPEPKGKKKKTTTTVETEETPVEKMIRRVHRDLAERIDGLETGIFARLDAMERAADRRGALAKTRAERRSKDVNGRMRDLLTQVKMVRTRTDMVLDMFKEDETEEKKDETEEKEDETEDETLREPDGDVDAEGEVVDTVTGDGAEDKEDEEEKVEEGEEKDGDESEEETGNGTVAE